MRKVNLVFYPNKKLRVKCQEVSKRNWQKALEIVDGLCRILSETSNGVGLSAPQIGGNLRVFIMKGVDCSSGCENCHCLQVFINPKIITVFGKEKAQPEIKNKDGETNVFLEGCLSFPNLYGTVNRWSKIKVKYQDENDIEVKEILTGIKAIVFQHERDHLDGILFIDHIKEEKGKLFREVDGKLVSEKIIE